MYKQIIINEKLEIGKEGQKNRAKWERSIKEAKVIEEEDNANGAEWVLKLLSCLVKSEPFATPLFCIQISHDVKSL